MSASWNSPFPARSPALASSIALLFAATLALSACGKKDAAPAAAGGPPGGGMPLPQVGVVTVQPGNVGIETELPGRIEASRIAQVRARAAGILQKRLFAEGSDVKAGQVLYQIDPGPYAASAQSAAASLQRAEANLAQASATVQRYKPLVEVNAISRQDYVNAQASEKQAQADVAVSKATVANAQITLGYAQVTAPISGRIGRSLVTEGALVGQGEATQLAVIQQINPVYVNFTQSVAEVSRLRAAMQKGQLQRAAGAEAAVVHIVQEDGTVLPQTGKLLFADLSVDATTGQITLRAEVPNPGGVLLPGLYVRVRIEQAQVQNAMLVPQQAVTRTQQGDSVSVVGADGKITPRQIKVNGSKDNQWVVTEGLKAGDQVMVDGFQKLQMAPPGTPVKAVPWQAPGSAPAAAPAAAPAPAAK